MVHGTGISIAVTGTTVHTISLVDTTDDTGVTTITATGSTTTPGTLHFAGNVNGGWLRDNDDGDGARHRRNRGAVGADPTGARREPREP